MRKAVFLLLALMLALPLSGAGEGTDMPVDAFIERTGLEADAATRERIESFLRERYITAPMLDMMDDARLARYARNLAEDLPIAYPELTEAPSQPMPEDAEPARLAVLWPQGAAMESMLVDFERGLAYYDETFPVTEDVCRARHAARLTGADARALLDIFDNIALEDQAGEMTGVEFSAIRLAVGWEGGVTRCIAAGEGVSEAFLNGVRALLDAGRAAAQGDDL